MFKKHKIITGFPCNDKSSFMIITEDFGSLITYDKEEFEKVMFNKFIKIDEKELEDDK